MSSPIKAQVSGTFTTPATLVPVNISIPSGFNNIEIINLTDIVTATNTPAAIMKARGESAMPNSTSLTWSGTGSGYSLTQAVNITSGFTFVADSAAVALGAAVTNVTGISQAATAVVATITPPVAGQVVKIYSTTGMLQIAGMDFTVGTVVGSTSFQLAYLNSSGFGAAGTAGTFRVVSYDPRFYPRRRHITAITAANPAVVTMSVTHGFAVGELVRMVVPSAFGMTQMDGQLATITAISTTSNTITLNVDASAFTAFAFPTSAVAALGVTPAQVIPVGEAATSPYQNLLDDATQNLSFTGVTIDTGILVASKNYSWTATKGQSV